MINFDNEKMSKSLGNVVNIRRVRATNDLEALRLLFVSTHYRSPVGFTIGKDGETFPDLDDAEERLEHFYRVLERLDEAGAGAAAQGDLSGEVVPPADRTLAACGETLGIFRRPPREFLLARRARRCARLGIESASVEAQIAARAAARSAKDFARADEIR